MNRQGMVMLGVLALLLGTGTASGQVRLENVSITMGVGGEMYGSDGNFLSIAVPQVDSTDSALGASGDMGAAGTLIFMADNGRSLITEFDFGMRQFWTGGFQARNYAPRELSGRVRANYSQHFGGGTLAVIPSLDSRRIADRPPLPLYLAPGYSAGAVVANYSRAVATDLAFYGQLTGETKDYTADLPALDDLDRRSAGLEAGVQMFFRGRPETRDPEIRDQSTLRFFGTYLHHSYPKQGEGLLRRDNAARIGGEFTLDRRDTQGFQLALRAHGTRSRSNSRRVDYNAGRIEVEGSVELGEDTQLDLQGLWAVKRYINQQDFLIPGEEADNATIVFAQVTRFLRDGVRAGIGGGWRRAETNFSGAYYQRFSMSFSLTVSPRF